MSDGGQVDVSSLAQQMPQLSVKDHSEINCGPVSGLAVAEPAASPLPQVSASNSEPKKELQTPEVSHLDPALKQALLDNRSTVLELEETVLRFIGDSSQSSLPFPPSTSNYQRLLEHKVSQYHQLLTQTAFENGQPKVAAKRPGNITLAPQQKLADIDVATIKVEPKALIKRPPSQQQQHYGHGNSQQRQQQIDWSNKSHKDREADYHEARARIIGNSSSSANGSGGNLAGLARSGGNLAGSSSNLAGNRPASAGASSSGAALGNSYLAAVPPTHGDRGFNIVNPGRGMGRGSSSSSIPAAAGVAAPGTSAGRGTAAAAVPSEPAAAAAAAGGSNGLNRRSPNSRQQQQYGAGGPKAIYRDKQRDVQDPDYARGVDRYQSRFDPGYGASMQQQQQPGAMYVMPTYGSEFPSLGGAYGSQQQQNGGAAAANGQQQQQLGGASNSSRPPVPAARGGSNQQQQQQQYNQAYDMYGYGATPYPFAADPAAAAAMYNTAGYGSYANPNGIGGAYVDPYAAAAYNGYGGYGNYGAMPAGNYQMAYGGYGGYPAGAPWQQQQQQGYVQQQQQGGRGGQHGSSSSNAQQQQQR